MSKILFYSLAVVFTAGLTTMSLRSSATLSEEGPKGCRIITGEEVGKCAKNTEDTYTCFVAAEGETKDCTSSN